MTVQDMTADYVIVGGGIVGLATGMALLERYPDARLLLLDKEDAIAQHQTGHNSGVIHSGIYYKPGSYKARFAIEGARIMPEFCQEHGIAYDVCGKIIVATEDNELDRLESLYQRGLEHGLAVTRLDADGIKAIEPHCAGKAGVKVPSTGIADYKGVSKTYAKLIEQRGGHIVLSCRVTGLTHDGDTSILHTTRGDIRTKLLINCGGLQCDRIARFDNVEPPARIVPFRGEYYELKPEKRHLCKHLIYPVPDPQFPFLGVHLTRMIDGNIHCGPNAVLALKREGYTWGDISLADTWDALTYKGFWALAKKNWRDGMMEVWRSLSKRAFTQSLRRLIPDIEMDDLVPSHAGVRAQALLPDGTMVHDFLIERGENSVHVLNAPSPAATASIAIGREVAKQIPSVTPTQVAVSTTSAA